MMNVRPLISVVVPTRLHGSAELVLRTLAAQTCQDFEVHVVVDHAARGAPWARNRGAERAAGRYLLFSDDDVTWEPDALASLVVALQAAQAVEQEGRDEYLTAYAWGGYHITRNGHPSVTRGNEPWDLGVLMERNVVPTMALMERELFPGFDERLTRLQDWDLWLGLALRAHYRGQWIGRVLFTTPEAPTGISSEGAESYQAAWRAVRTKYGLPI